MPSCIWKKKVKQNVKPLYLRFIQVHKKSQLKKNYFDFFNLLGSFKMERIFGENDLIMLLIMLHVLLVGWLDMFIVFCESKPRDLNTKYCCIALKGREHKKFESVGWYFPTSLENLLFYSLENYSWRLKVPDMKILKKIILLKLTGQVHFQLCLIHNEKLETCIFFRSNMRS